MQAIIIGAGTACQDNPKLNIRYGLKHSGFKHPYRVILDPSGRTPLDYHLFDSNSGGPVIICVSHRSNPEHKARLAHHATVWEIPEISGTLDWLFLLQKLGENNCHDILIEGGQAVFSSAITENIVDEVHLFSAPCLMGSNTALSAFRIGSFHTHNNRVQLYHPTYMQFGNDMYLNAVLKPDG
jgi:diaminohydroxyphosphoribosylaminopyrimidine deaminase/5-amino-6-(5-phosphoribosylamino)uracil reductase